MPEWLSYISGTNPNVLATFETVTGALAWFALALPLFTAVVVVVVCGTLAMVLASFGMCLQASLHHLAQPFAPLNTLVATLRRRLGSIAHIFWDLLLLQLALVVGSRWHH